LRDAIRSGEALMQGLRDAGKRIGIPVQTTGFGTAFSVHFTERATLRTYRDTLDDNTEMLRLWLAECLEEGVYLMPDGRVYTSVVHTANEIERVLDVFERALQRAAKKISSSVGISR
jgi:glutamate-1-semialdehyde 2,1-aminomutase